MIHKLDLSENDHHLGRLIDKPLSLSSLHRYPDPEAKALRSGLASMHGVLPENILVFNGLDEAILILNLHFKQKDAVLHLSEKTFPIYSIAANLVGNPTRLYDFSKVSANGLRSSLVQDRNNVLVLINPHNPSGRLVSKEQLELLLGSSVPTPTRLVLDEAYIDFVDHGLRFDWNQYVRHGNAPIVLRSFSKSWGLAGIRCGYIVADALTVTNLMNCKKALPFSVNAVAQEVCLGALADAKDILDRSFSENLYCRTHLEAFLHEIHVPFIASHTNFIQLLLDSERYGNILQSSELVVKDLVPVGHLNSVRLGVPSRSALLQVEGLLRKLLCTRRTADLPVGVL